MADSPQNVPQHVLDDAERKTRDLAERLRGVISVRDGTVYEGLPGSSPEQQAKAADALDRMWENFDRPHEPIDDPEAYQREHGVSAYLTLPAGRAVLTGVRHNSDGHPAYRYELERPDSTRP